jgi:hypothetical protein
MPQSPDFDFLGQRLLYQTLNAAGQNMIETHKRLRGSLRGNPDRYAPVIRSIEDTIEIVLPMPCGHFKVTRNEDDFDTLAAEVMHDMDRNGAYQTPVFETLEIVEDRLVFSRTFKERSYEIGTGCFTEMDAEGLATDYFVTNCFDIRLQPGKLAYPQQVFGWKEYCEAKFDLLTTPGDALAYARSKPVGHLPHSAIYREDDPVACMIHELVYG